MAKSHKQAAQPKPPPLPQNFIRVMLMVEDTPENQNHLRATVDAVKAQAERFSGKYKLVKVEQCRMLMIQNAKG